MKQNEFFNILMDGLKDFPETKLQDIISYYDNKIAIGLASGKTEEEILSELDNPNLIVKKYRNEDININFNSQQIANESITTSISNKNSSNDSNSDNRNNNITGRAFTEAQNTITDNNLNDIYSDFNTNDNFNNSNDNEINSVIHMKSNDIKTNDSYETPSLNDNFYDLYNSNTSSVSKEGTYRSNSSNETNSSFNDESNFSPNINNNNSDFNNKQNSDNFSTKFNNINSNNKSSKYNVNNILRFCIVGLALIIFFPVITGIIGFFFGLLGVAISILVGSIGILIGGTFTSFIGLPNVPMFIANFPYPVIVLFSLGSISLSILLTLLFYYLCKFFIQISIKFYKSLKSKGGAF